MKTTNGSSWFKKFIETLLTAVSITNFLLGFATVLPQKIMQYFPMMMLSSWVASVVFALVFTIYWHKGELKQNLNSERIHAWLQGILRYLLAFFLSIYGFAKLFNAQFVSSFHLDDSLVNTLTGSQLTWNYFAYSIELSVIIGLCQIGGGMLLLFRRTTLAGVAILLPIMLNVVLINQFYQISIGAFINSVVYTSVLIYLLSLYRKELIELFYEYKNKLPEVCKPSLRNTARILSIGLAFGFVFYVVNKNKTDEKYVGKWEVDSLSRNGKTMLKNDWVQDSTAWKVVYFENNKQIYLCPNPFVYEDARSLFLTYQYESGTDDLTVISYERNPQMPDTIPIRVSVNNEKQLQWDWILYGDTIQMQLVKSK